MRTLIKRIEENGASGLNDVMLQPPFQNMEIILDWLKKEYHQLYELDIKQDILTLMRFNKVYEEDSKSGFRHLDIMEYLSPETIKLVVGADQAAELFDKMAANLLRKYIDISGSL